MGRLAKFTKQIISLLVGLPLLVVGIILIPIPGPGLLVCFLALLVLSWGFEGAKKHLESTKAVFRRLYREAKARADKIEKR
jgi:uncharacterized protein (TIGR02611 family)